VEHDVPVDEVSGGVKGQGGARLGSGVGVELGVDLDLESGSGIWDLGSGILDLDLDLLICHRSMGRCVCGDVSGAWLGGGTLTRRGEPD
jgi:hypothetical protein